MLSAYAVSLRAKSQFLTENINNPEKLEPFLDDANSLFIICCRSMGSSSLDELKAVMRTLNDPTGIPKYTNPDIIIKLLNEDGDPVMTWSVLNAWVSKFQSTGLKADGSEAAIETMEIVHEGLTLEKN